MSEQWAIPQPWQVEGSTQEDFMSGALKREREGATLVVQTLVNGYPDDDLYTWAADALVLTDWRTGKHLLTWNLDGEDPECLLDGMVVVEVAVTESG